MDGTFGKPLPPQLALCTGLQFSREWETDVRHSARPGPSCTLTMQLDGPPRRHTQYPRPIPRLRRLTRSPQAPRAAPRGPSG